MEMARLVNLAPSCVLVFLGCWVSQRFPAVPLHALQTLLL